MKVGITIEARMGSSRLPGKTMKELFGKPMLEQMVNRLKKVRTADEIIIATTENKIDQPIVELAKKLGVGYFQGSENDVLDRVLNAAKKYDIDLIVETCGDCPLIDPLIIEYEIATFLNNDFDYVGCHLRKTWPIGLDAKLFTTQTLDEVARKTNEPPDRENVSLYIYEHPNEYKIHNIEATGRRNRPDLRFVVDYKEDFDLVEKIYKSMEPDHSFNYTDILSFLDKYPHIAKINSGVHNIEVAGRE